MFNLPDGRPAVMGILNVTPDSFSDGGRWLDPEAAVAHAVEMMAEGADLIDVGGESTRPGSESVGEDEEQGRIVPVCEELGRRSIPFSIDTRRSSTARKAIACGACMVNDVTAGTADPAMAHTVAQARVAVCLMHMQGQPKSMQAAPTYVDVVAEVTTYLKHRAAAFESAGTAREKIIIDPGIGFGKNSTHNLALIANLSRLAATGFPVGLGVSRKSLLGRIISSGDFIRPPEERLSAGLAIQAWAQAQGVRMLRVHDVRAARDAVDAMSAVLGAVQATE